MNISFNAGPTLTICCHLHHVLTPGTELRPFGKALRVKLHVEYLYLRLNHTGLFKSLQVSELPINLKM